MAPRGEPLRIRVATQKQQDRQREPGRPRVGQEQQGRGHKSQAADQQQPDNAPHGQQPRRQVPARRPRVASINLPIDQPIERHGDRAGEDHAQHDPDQFLPAPAPPLDRRLPPREDRREQRKRQGEQRMAESHQLQVSPDQVPRRHSRSPLPQIGVCRPLRADVSSNRKLSPGTTGQIRPVDWGWQKKRSATSARVADLRSPSCPTSPSSPHPKTPAS